MTLSSVVRRISALALVLGASAALHAQLPVNNDMWKTRCNVLATSAPTIDAGSTPAPLVSATRGIKANDFFVVAVNRADADQHYVACAMYYLAAISARTGNGGKADASAASTYATLASAELKQAKGESLSMGEYMKRVQMKFNALTGTPLTLTPAQTSAVIDAAGTMPLLSVPSAGSQASR
jgi:hypothetical protein